ncbi:MAG: hypothetical protein PHV20_02250 [Bacteroidales bacterium]|nr:hypothetical protein [Bacteroidales bacterium]
MKRMIILGLLVGALSMYTQGVIPVKGGLKNPKLQSILSSQAIIPSEELFYLKYPRHTFDEWNVNLVKKLRKPSKSQISAWLFPLLGKGVFNFNLRLVSIQKETDTYTAFTILRIIEIGADINLKEIILGEQYLITVDQNGKYISGKKIFDNFRTDDRDEENIENNYDKEIESYIMYDDISTSFTKDTIEIKESMALKKDYFSKAKETYSKKSFTTKYLISKNGIIQKISGRCLVALDSPSSLQDMR